jgi:hypothetical protein
VTVPDGYRGPLTIDLQPIAGRIQGEVGARCFEAQASGSGYVRVAATPLLLAIDDIDCIGARYEDGRAVPYADYRVTGDDVALRWIESVGNRRLFVIGTLQDKQKVEAAIYDHVAEEPGAISLNHKAFDALFFDASKATEDARGSTQGDVRKQLSTQGTRP